MREYHCGAQAGLKLFWFFKTGFLCVMALAVLELALADQADLTHRDPFALASQVLGLKPCTTTTQLGLILLTASDLPVPDFD